MFIFSSGGDKIPCKGGPGTTQSDLLVIDTTDLHKIQQDRSVEDNRR